MNQCVPRCNSKDHQANIINLPFSMPGFSEREVIELTWRNGKPQLGKLESIIEQGTTGIAGETNLASREGSCSGDGEREKKKARRWSSPEDTSEFYGGMSSSLSPENISSGEDDDSLCRSRSSQRDRKGRVEEKKNKKVIGRRRVAAIHNQSERKRRYRINQKMRALQKLVPNSSQTDKASMLDEVINYLKQLQNQVKMMTCVSHMTMMMMMMPNLQMSLMAHQRAQMAQITRMGLGLGFMGLGSEWAGDRTNAIATSPPPASLPAFHRRRRTNIAAKHECGCM